MSHDVSDRGARKRAVNLEKFEPLVVGIIGNLVYFGHYVLRGYCFCLIVTVLKVVEFPFSSHFVTILNPIFLSVAQCVFGCTTLI